MALPLIPFAAGLALGSLVTYGYKDKTVHDRIIQGAEEAYAWAKEGLTAIRDWIPGLAAAKELAPEVVEAKAAEAAEQIAAAAEATVEAAEEVQEVVAKPAARKARQAAGLEKA